jgi:hypothetical protein
MQKMNIYIYIYICIYLPVRNIKLPTQPCALGSTQPLKMSTRKTPGGKAGRCVRLTTYHLHSAESGEDPGALTSWIPKGRLRPVAGK